MSQSLPGEPDRRTPPELQPLLDELQRLEPLFHAAAAEASVEAFEALVAPDFWETGASGRRYDRAFALGVLRDRPAVPGPEQWQTADPGLQPLGPGVYLYTYTLQQPGRATRRMTVWRREPSRWQAVYHQGTVLV